MRFDSRETKSAKECLRDSSNPPAFPPKQREGEADLWAGLEDREGGVLSRDGTRGVGVS